MSTMTLSHVIKIEGFDRLRDYRRVFPRVFLVLNFEVLFSFHFRGRQLIDPNTWITFCFLKFFFRLDVYNFFISIKFFAYIFQSVLNIFFLASFLNTCMNMFKLSLKEWNLNAMAGPSIVEYTTYLFFFQFVLGILFTLSLKVFGMYFLSIIIFLQYNSIF